MYEEATILNYSDKKIWIKYIVDKIYCINGRYVKFLNFLNEDSINEIVDALDLCYSPLYNDSSEMSILVFYPLLNNTTNCGMAMYDVNQYVSDTVIRRIKNAYETWLTTVDESDIYVHDCRQQDLSEWLMQHNPK